MLPGNARADKSSVPYLENGENSVKGGSQNMEFIYLKKNLFILTCLNISALQSTHHLMQLHLLRLFFHCAKLVFELADFDTF